MRLRRRWGGACVTVPWKESISKQRRHRIFQDHGQKCIGPVCKEFRVYFSQSRVQCISRVNIPGTNLSIPKHMTLQSENMNRLSTLHMFSKSYEVIMSLLAPPFRVLFPGAALLGCGCGSGPDVRSGSESWVIKTFGPRERKDQS